jgi:hypothetical protein
VHTAKSVRLVFSGAAEQVRFASSAGTSTVRRGEVVATTISGHLNVNKAGAPTIGQLHVTTTESRLLGKRARSASNTAGEEEEQEEKEQEQEQQQQQSNRKRRSQRLAAGDQHSNAEAAIEPRALDSSNLSLASTTGSSSSSSSYAHQQQGAGGYLGAHYPGGAMTVRLPFRVTPEEQAVMQRQQDRRASDSPLSSSSSSSIVKRPSLDGDSPSAGTPPLYNQQQQQYMLPQFDAESALAMDMTAAQLSIYQTAERRRLEQAQRLEVEQVEAAERARAQAQQEAAALAQQLQQQAEEGLALPDLGPFSQALAFAHSGSSSTPQSPLQGLPPFRAGLSLTAPLVAVNSWGTEVCTQSLHIQVHCDRYTCALHRRTQCALQIASIAAAWNIYW